MPLTSATFLPPILTATSVRGSYLGSLSVIFSEVWATQPVAGAGQKGWVGRWEGRLGRDLAAPTCWWFH